MTKPPANASSPRLWGELSWLSIGLSMLLSAAVLGAIDYAIVHGLKQPSATEPFPDPLTLIRADVTRLKMDIRQLATDITAMQQKQSTLNADVAILKQESVTSHEQAMQLTQTLEKLRQEQVDEAKSIRTLVESSAKLRRDLDRFIKEHGAATRPDSGFNSRSDR